MTIPYEQKKKIEELFERTTAEQFIRYHKKLVEAIIMLEIGFKRRFPQEYEVWDREFYKDVDRSEHD